MFHFFFNFRSKKWLQACGRPDLYAKTPEMLHKTYVICDLHFKPDDFLKRHLRQFVIPTQNLPGNITASASTQTDEFCIIEQSIKVEKIKQEETILKEIDVNAVQENVVYSVQTQTEPDLTAETIRKRKLLRKLAIKAKRQRLSNIKQQYNAAPIFCKLIDLQCQLKQKYQSNKNSRRCRLFVLNMYFASPLSYRLFSNTLELPTQKTLQKMNIDVGTKLCPDVLRYLELKIKHMKEPEKYCTICVDEISLKRHLFYQINNDKIIGFHEINGVQMGEPATQALVIMARGIFFNWQQPLGYCLLSQSRKYKELNNWVDEVIEKVMEIGLKVVAVVTDQDSKFLNVTVERNVCLKKPYAIINGKKVYHIFDVHRLFKSIRNSLTKYNFEFLTNKTTKTMAKWSDIEKFFREDTKRLYRLAPKLTESHINAYNFKKMTIKHVTDVFSSSVAAGMDFYIENGLLDNDCKGTVKFITLMDKTFNVLNSSVKNNSNRYKEAFAFKPYQNDLLKQADLFLSQANVLNKSRENVTETIKWLKGLKITIKSIKCLAQDLQSEGFPYLFTRKLNLESLEQLLVSIRQQGGQDSQDPTAIQFTRAFKKSFIENMFKHSVTVHSSNHLEHWLRKISDETTVSNESESLLVEEDDDTTIDPTPVSVGAADYRFDLPENNALEYVSEYLLRKCFDMHKCAEIMILINQSENQVPSVNDNNVGQINLVKPPDNFVNCIRTMEDRVRPLFSQQHILKSIGNELLKNLEDISFNSCCDSFPNDYLRKLFVRFRIYNVLKVNKKIFADKSSKRKHFLVNSI